MLKDHNRNTSRAAILPFPGDPLLFTYWYGLFKKVWSMDVDKLYIIFNSPIEKKVVDYVKGLVAKDKKVHLHYINTQIEHGAAIDLALGMVTEDYVMLIEDDCYVWGIGAISQCFNQLEYDHYDIVASKRASCGQEILDEAQKQWGLKYEGLGDQGPNFWPNLFFCKTELLKKTDRNFGARRWDAGDKIEPLNYICKTEQCGDTFVNTSLQLRKLVPEDRIYYIPQYHGHPQDLEHYEKRRFLFDGKAQWCHIGSLSSGVGGLIKDDQNRTLARRTIDPPAGETILDNKPTNEFEKWEYERRVQWWDTFYWSGAHVGIAEFKRLYKEGLDRIVSQFKLNRKNIMKRRQAYSKLMNGDEL